MKVLAFNGSPRAEGNTYAMIQHVFKELNEEGIETELIQMGGSHPHGCKACMVCMKKQNRQCVITEDPMNEWIAKMIEADALILGSPTYFADVSTEMKALIDRAGLVCRVNGDLLMRKPAAAVVAVRRGGSIHVFDTMNHFFTIAQMIVVGSSYWNIGYGLKPGDVEQDEEGINTMVNLGKNMAWILKKIHA